MNDQNRDAGRTFAERYAHKRTKSEEEVADWITGRGQLVIGAFCLFVVIGMLASVVVSLL